VVFARLPWVEPPFIAQVGLLCPAVVWAYGSILSAVVLFPIRAAGRLGHPFSRVPRRVAVAAPAVPRDHGRRRVLQAGAAGLASAPFAIAGYGTASATQAFGLTELSLLFGRPLRVVHLSDIHAGLYMTHAQVTHRVDLVHGLQPDLFVVTGDFISNSMSFVYGCAEALARARARYGTFAVLGDHEHWYGNPQEVEAVFRAHRVALLNSTHRVVQTDRGPFAVAGIDDLGHGHADLEAARQGLDASIPTVLLSHYPEIFPQAARRRIPLTLAGHWHGGQIRLRLPGLDLSVAHLLTPYIDGLHRLNTSHLYVTRGIGTAWTPIRLNAPPEVVVLTLT